MTDDHLHATISLRGVLFNPDDDVLVVKRASNGGWELPGGRLGPEEDAADGVRREIREETSLDVTVEHPVHAISWRNDDGKGRFGVYYYCRATDVDVAVSPEHTDYEWLDPDAAAARLSSPQEAAVRRAQQHHDS